MKANGDLRGDLDTLEKLMVRFMSEPERESAANLFVKEAASAHIDIRDLRLRHVGQEEREEEEASERRLREYRRMQDLAYPEQAAMQRQIDALLAENRKLKGEKRALQRGPTDEDITDLKAEVREWKAQARRNAKLLEQSQERSFLFQLCKRALEAMRQQRDVGEMDQDECLRLVESHKPIHLTTHEAVVALGYEDGEVTKIPLWLRVALRAARPLR